jgi:hypothetical protein
VRHSLETPGYPLPLDARDKFRKMRSMQNVPAKIDRAFLRGFAAATLIFAALFSPGCNKGQAPGAKRAGSPYADYVPKEAPLEKNRVTHPTGFSLVSPVDWTMRIRPVEPFLKDYVADEFLLEGPQSDELKPVITVQHLGPAAQRQWEAFAKPGARIGDGNVRAQFHGETAFTRFLAGSGKTKTKRGQALSQQLVFKSAGQWFLLEFRMRNADNGEPYYTQPLKIVQDFFETFAYQPAGK